MAERYEVGWQQCKTEAEERAWQRTGFTGPDHVKQSVRQLTPEQKLDLLVEIFIDELAQKHFENKVEFMEKLGKDMTVSSEEMERWLRDTFKGPEWRIDTGWIEDTRISSDFQLVAARSYAPKGKKRR